MTKAEIEALKGEIANLKDKINIVYDFAKWVSKMEAQKTERKLIIYAVYFIFVCFLVLVVNFSIIS